MSLDNISSLLAELEISLAGQIVAIPNSPAAFFVPVAIRRTGDGPPVPSKKTLLAAKHRLEQAGVLAEFLIVDKQTVEIEHSLRSSLLISYADLIRNSFLSREATDTTVWIEPKRALDPAERDRISEHVIEFAKLFALEKVLVLSLEDTTLATKYETLAAIRALAPVDCEHLRVELVRKGYTVPSLDWINRQFDLLRKAGLLVRLNDRRYVMSLDGLKRLGTTKNRRSPDIQRLLALARRRG